MPHAEEQPLTGGNVSAGVVRVGDTVRRPAGPWTPSVHALLTHLHEAGFRSAPRPLGIDERGREVLAFVPGEVVWPDRFALVEPTAGLVRVARMIRDFHDAVQDFRPPRDACWQVLVPAEGDDIIAHQDLAPWNLVAGESGWAFIDWDTAAPGSRLWDVAYAVRGFVPLSAHPDWQTPDAAARLRLFADAYGLDCWAAAPARCTTSCGSRTTWATSPGPGSGPRGTATPGAGTPSTSRCARSSGCAPCCPGEPWIAGGGEAPTHLR